jgi:UDP-glucuronate decarboxylase
LRKKVLVTGGSGFLGSHLCKWLLEKKYDVIAVDNLHTGSIQNIELLLKLDNFEFIEHDITKPLQIQVDQIYNLACPASPLHYQTDPVKTIQTNVHGVINMLDLANSINAKILQSSTSEVYGDPLVHPQKEEYWGNVNPIGYRACYDEGKRCAETLFFDYHRQYDMKIKVARIFNTFGPNMAINDGRVVSNFILQALDNKPITIYGKGEQTRSFCYVDDLIKGLILLMNSDDSLTGPVNLGNPNEMQIKTLAEKIIEMTNSSSVIEYKMLPQDDPIKRKPDISLAQEVLNWEPIISLDEGLQNTISYFEKTFVA